MYSVHFVDLINVVSVGFCLDVSRDSEDSGIGHAILESPCIPLFSSPSLFSSSSLPAHLARLQAFPVSPNSPHKLLDISRPVVEEFVYSIHNSLGIC